jgi:hypothetical protein
MVDHFQEERRLGVFGNRDLRRMFGPEGEEITGEGENYIMRLMNCAPHLLLFG